MQRKEKEDEEVEKRAKGGEENEREKREEARRRRGEKPEGRSSRYFKACVAQPSINSTCLGLFVKAELSESVSL